MQTAAELLSVILDAAKSLDERADRNRVSDVRLAMGNMLGALERFLTYQDENCQEASRLLAQTPTDRLVTIFAAIERAAQLHSQDTRIAALAAEANEAAKELLLPVLAR